jgi:3-deoxy-D-arabino-heptulosonate 7-phosphate (DAHP) synthase
MTRNTMDLGSIPRIERLTHRPVIVDPSHGTGDRQSVPPLARAALTPEGFADLMTSLRAIPAVVGRRI